VAWIADEKRVACGCPACEQSRLRSGEPECTSRSRSPAVPVVVPHRDVLFHHLHACAAQARDHLRVARIAAFVGSEVADFQSERRAGAARGRISERVETAARAKPARPLCGAAKSASETAARAKPARPLCGAAKSAPQERISSTSSSARSRSCARSSWWLVIISLISPSEKNCIPITTSSTPSINSGRCPIACPSALITVR